MADLLFSLNAVAPLFLIMLLGFILKRRAFIDEAFVESGTKICFHVALPCLLFLNIVQSDLTQAFDMRLTVFCVVGFLAYVLLLRLIAPRFIREIPTYSAFIQVTFRSNYALLGLPFIYNLAGSSGLAMAATLLAIMIPLFNVLAVLVLAENQGGAGQGLGKLVKQIVTNPLIIGCVLGIIASLLPFQLPLLLERSLSYVSDMAMPLALFAIGSSLNLDIERDRIHLALASSLIKLVIGPLCAVLIAYYLGFNPVQMAIVLALFAGPPSTSCFPMAFEMGADYKLTSLTIATSTTLAAFTMFGFVYVMRVMGLI